jgi:hypothetical protein
MGGHFHPSVGEIFLLLAPYYAAHDASRMVRENALIASLLTWMLLRICRPSSQELSTKGWGLRNFQSVRVYHLEIRKIGCPRLSGISI